MFRKALLSLLLLVTTILPIQHALAATVSFSPVKFEFEIAPGSSVSDSIEVRNTEQSSRTFQVSIMNFTSPEDESGTPVLYEPGDSAHDDGRGIHQWVEITRDAFSVGAGEVRYVPFVIHVPNTAAPGSYFGAILVSDVTGDVIIGGREEEVSPDSIGGSLGVKQKAGPIVLVTVTGDEGGVKADIAEFFRDKKIYTSLPVRLFTRVENNSARLIKPAGEIMVTRMTGGEVGRLKFNEGANAVLPNSIRKFETTWQRRELSADTPEFLKEIRNFGLGRYRAELKMIYGIYGREESIVTSAQTFWVFPWQLLLLFVALLLVLRFFVRRYNAAIVRSAQRRAQR